MVKYPGKDGYFEIAGYDVAHFVQGWPLMPTYLETQAGNGKGGVFKISLVGIDAAENTTPARSDSATSRERAHTMAVEMCTAPLREEKLDDEFVGQVFEQYNSLSIFGSQG